MFIYYKINKTYFMILIKLVQRCKNKLIGYKINEILNFNNIDGTKGSINKVDYVSVNIYLV